MFKRLLVALGLLLGLASAAAAAPPPLENYGALPAVEMAAMSASGERVALAGAVNGKRRLIVLGPDKKALVGVELSEEKLRDLKWAGDDYVLIKTSRMIDMRIQYGSNYEIFQVNILNVNTGKIAVALSGRYVRNGVWGDYGVREIDGKWWAFYGGMTMRDGGGLGVQTPFLVSGHPDLYKVDLDTGAGKMIAKGGEEDRSRRWVLNERGEILARTEYDDAGRWRLYFGEKERLSLEDKLGDNRLVGMGRAPGTILYYAEGPDGRAFYEMGAETPEWGQRLIDEETGSYYLLRDPWTSLVLATVKSGEKVEYSFYAAQHQKRVAALSRAFPGYRVDVSSFAKDFSKVLVFVDGKDSPGVYYTVDFKTMKADQLAIAYPAVQPQDVGEIRLVRYKAGDGLDIEGVLTLPPGKPAKNLPVVVLPHGGPNARDYPVFDWQAQAFASRGYAVFQPNFRGSSGYGLEFHEAGDGEFGGKMQSDVSDGVAYLAKEGVIDPKRACIVGGSYGGFAAVAGVTLQQGLYRCAVSYAGVMDWHAMGTYDISRGGDTTRRSLKQQIGSFEVMRAISPVNLAEKADAPVLLIHGKDDTVVPLEQSKGMEKALRRAGKPVELIVLDGEDHWLSRGATRIAMLKAAVGFVEKHNPAD